MLNATGKISFNSEWLVIYLVFINLITFVVFGIDKYKAIKRQYRISEKMLFLLAVIGGTIGAGAGMGIFNHKTRKWKFRVGIPVILLIQVLVCFLILTN